MQYNQPYGIGDPNAGYINGNPATGTMGSIPPAAAIELPQREITNLISQCAITPSNADLSQISRAVQSGRLNWGWDQGWPNYIVIYPTVIPSGYSVGQRFIIRLAYGNTSTVQVNVGGLGWVPLIHTNLTPITAKELVAGQLMEIAYDGAQFQLTAGGTSGQFLLDQPIYFYCNPYIGSDEAYDGSSATPIGGTAGPFRTIPKALSMLRKYNLGGWSFTVFLADGTYTGESVYLPLPNGSGWVQIIGNQGNPSAVLINCIGPGSSLIGNTGGNYLIDGVSCRNAFVRPGDPSGGLWWQSDGYMLWQRVHFHGLVGPTNCVGPGGAYMFLSGDQNIAGPCSGAYIAFANGVNYVNTGNGTTDLGHDMTISTSINVGDFVSVGDNGTCRPIWRNIYGKGNVSGRKFSASMNGVIQVGGRGLDYLPGHIPGIYGVTSGDNGGQYS